MTATLSEAPRKRRRLPRERRSRDQEKRANALALGERLRRHRLTNGIALTHAAKTAGLCESAWRAYELGTRTPRPWRLAQLAAAIGIPVGQLVTDDLVLAEVRVSAETTAAVKKGGMPAAQEAAQRLAAALAPLLLAEATRPPVDLSPGARPKRRRSRAQVLKQLPPQPSTKRVRERIE